MKKIISIMLAVILVVSACAISAGAVNYNPPADGSSYTVSADTPTCKEAILECSGSLENTQTFYFQAPDPSDTDPDHRTAEWKNEFNTLPGTDYGQVCVYWASGTGTKWPSGAKIAWVGYRTELVDKEQRIYRITMPNDGNSPFMVINNGIDAGMDKDAPIFKRGAQTMDLNSEGAAPDDPDTPEFDGDYDTLPEGSPVFDVDEYVGDWTGCIAVMDYTTSQVNKLTGFSNYGVNWYIYYGKGCYGSYPTTSTHFTSRYANCLNPQHLADPEKYHPLIGDVNEDKSVDVLDVECIQRFLAKLDDLTESQQKAADVDDDSYVSIIDATRIQRALAGLCNIDDPASTPETPAIKTS